MPAIVTLSDEAAAVLAADAARAGQNAAAYLTRLILDARARSAASRRNLLLARAEQVQPLYRTASWVWNGEVRLNSTAVAGWMVRTGRPLQIVIEGRPQLVLQSYDGFHATLGWFELARHFLAHP